VKGEETACFSTSFFSFFFLFLCSRSDDLLTAGVCSCGVSEYIEYIATVHTYSPRYVTRACPCRPLREPINALFTNRRVIIMYSMYVDADISNKYPGLCVKLHRGGNKTQGTNLAVPHQGSGGPPPPDLKQKHIADVVIRTCRSGIRGAPTFSRYIHGY